MSRKISELSLSNTVLSVDMSYLQSTNNQRQEIGRSSLAFDYGVISLMKIIHI
ncbi:MAG: hypothetical protein IIB02_08545 [Thaumarchaeota archaeon]|nr:hypothetical protein [Nitrososphaerota archaeon]